MSTMISSPPGVKELEQQIEELKIQLAYSERERLQQARLLGMEGSKEAKLLAQIEESKKDALKFGRAMEEERNLRLKLQEENDTLRQDLKLAIAHDTQPYPTADAYEKMCELLNKEKQENAILYRDRDEGFKLWDEHKWKLDVAIEALEWYADRSNYDYHTYSTGPNGTHAATFRPILDDGFDKAIQALEKINI